MPGAAKPTVVPGLPAGAVVLLDVWAPWDVPSRSGQAEMDAVAGEFEERGLRVVGWAIADGTPASDWPPARHARETVARAQVDALGLVRALPTRLLVDRSGKVRQVYPGAALPEQARGDIAALLSEP